MILVREIRILRTQETGREILQGSFPDVREKVRKKLRLPSKTAFTCRILQHTLDARKKPQIFDVYTAAAEGIRGESELVQRLNDQNVLLYEEPVYLPAGSLCPAIGETSLRPIVIGAGPAGLFCALLLASAGKRPLLLERGKAVEEREQDVSGFWKGGKLDPDSNVQFGEGGAGTFSDGKLMTRIHDPEGRIRFVLETFVEAGAPAEILTESRAHIGTDCLRETVRGLRKKITGLGGEIRFGACVDRFESNADGRISAVILKSGERIPADTVVGAFGHSARDTFKMLQETGVSMEAKDFAVGFRILHSQEFIDRVQYGLKDPEVLRKLCLPPAAYQLQAKTSSGRGVYSFCMCPGGRIINASSEERRLAVNGMSSHGRDSGYANSGLVVAVRKSDFPGEDPLRGMRFQEQLEEAAFRAGDACIPVQRAGAYFSYLSGKRRLSEGAFSDPASVPGPAYEHPGFCGMIRETSLTGLLPPELEAAYEEGLRVLDRKIPGFAGGDGVLLAGVESRTSSPVRILRDDHCQGSLKGFYPCGEGAGYAGGITSAAVDGLKVAEAVIHA